MHFVLIIGDFSNFFKVRRKAMYYLLRWLPAVKCPVLVLHAEDDGIIPFRLGEQLVDSARQAGKNNIR